MRHILIWAIGTAITIVLGEVIARDVRKQDRKRYAGKSIFASLRGEPPFPKRWNLTGGHLAVDGEDLTWRRHMRKRIVVRMKRDRIQYVGQTRSTSKQFWVAADSVFVRCNYDGKTFDIAVLQLDVPELMRYLQR